MKLAAPIAAFSFAFAAFSVPALAQDCKLQMVNSISMMPAGPGGRMLVPVTINGTPKQFLLDTGSSLSELTESTAKALGLHVLDGARIKLLDTAGNATRRYTHVNDFQIGTMHGDFDMMISSTEGNAPNGPIDGMLAGDLMSRYDVEFDFAGRKLNYFIPNNCNGHVIYWPSSVVAVVSIKLGQPMRNIPFGGGLGNPDDPHIRVPITLEGKTFDAVLNTGAPNSTMSAETAKRVFGLTADSPGSVPLGTAGGAKVFGHVFDSLTFEGVTVNQPHVVIRPDLIGSKDPDNGVRTDSRALRVDDGIGPEVTLGMDVLKHLHLYVAYKEKKLYLTPADAPAAAPDAAAAKP